jgi:hypothetical protein
VIAKINGVIRGLLWKGLAKKVSGDIDPREKKEFCFYHL